jgi:hypothetical protein
MFIPHLDTPAMPIPTRQPGTTDSLTSHPVEEQRPGADQVGMQPMSTENLLLSRALLAPAPVPAPARALALDAMRLTRAMRDPERRPARWAQPGFGAQVELVRRHLAPVQSRRSLAASFGREAFHIVPSVVEDDDPSPIRLAYALRWMELGGGSAGSDGPLWAALFG